jgi:hypothetical protein
VAMACSGANFIAKNYFFKKIIIKNNNHEKSTTFFGNPNRINGGQLQLY